MVELKEVNWRITTWDAYRTQNAQEQFGNYLKLKHEALSDPATVKQMVEILAYSIIQGMELMGYDPKIETSKVIAKIPSEHDTSNPLDMYSTLGGKLWGMLNATPEKFARYIESQYGMALSEIRTLQTWKGFLRFKLNQLKRRIW